MNDENVSFMADLRTIHLGKKLDPAVIDVISEVIYGDTEETPIYRSSWYITKLFTDAGLNKVHDGTTRRKWVMETLSSLQPSELEKVILRLADPREYKADLEKLKMAVRRLNQGLQMDGFKVGFEKNKPVIRFGDELSIDDETVNQPAANDEAEFLQKNYSDEIKIRELKLEAELTEYLQDRVDEANDCPPGKVSLGQIFLLGSTLEGILLAYAINQPANFMSAKTAPVDKKTGKTLALPNWKLSQLIDTCHELQLLNLDVKKFSHALRDFRNFIHPYQQKQQKFKPDQHTVDICWQVFKAAFYQLNANTK